MAVADKALLPQKLPHGSFKTGQYRLSTKKWPNHYVYMQDGWRGYVSSWNGDAGPPGWWQLINHPTQPGYFLLSTSQWPQCFVFMEWGLIGSCRGWNKCDPGPQGYWKFVPHKDENGQNDGYYMITPQRPGWEDKWFIYVESGFSGNLSSWSGDPGPQGWFKVEPWNINLGAAMDQISMTMKELPAMPMLGSAASGYKGPDGAPAGGQATREPQLLSEICLEASFSECIDMRSLQPQNRSITLHVDQNTVFNQKVGRQHQEAFFSQLVPQRDMLASLSRSLFELSLEPPNNSPTLTKLSQNMICVGDRYLSKDESIKLQDGSQIRIGAADGQPPILILNIYCTSRSIGALGATCAHVPAMGRSPNRNTSGYSSYNDPPPPMPNRNNSQDNYPQRSAPSAAYDDRPPTMPMHGMGGGRDDYRDSGGSSSAALECVYSSGFRDLNRDNSLIPLITDQEVSIGRLHQIGFFEKLLPDHDSLACISRKHLTARLHRGGHLVEIENVSRNTVEIDNRKLNQGDKGDVREGSTLRFTNMDKTLLEFRLKSDASGSRGVPATRFA